MLHRAAVIVVLSLSASLCSAQAPGDEAARCTTDHSNPPVYPDNERTLMDSYSYVNLLPGHGTGQPIEEDAVWNDMSYDNNDIVNTLHPTYWQQGAGGICRYQIRVCGFKLNGVGPVVTQNNWLFTQHISKDFDPSIYNYSVDIWVEITYAGQSCRERNDCNPRFSLLTYITNTTQQPSTLGNGFMNRNNYGNNVTILPERTSVTYTEIHNFTLQPNEMGLYLAVHDYGTCLGISRLRVYRNNCQGHQTGLVVYPDTPAPESGSVDISVACVDNAVFTTSDIVTCDSSGTWGLENPECQCSPGYENDVFGTQCVDISLVPQPDSPEPVIIDAKNATAVTISWTASSIFSTQLVHTVYCTTNGVVMSEHEIVLPPGVDIIHLDIENGLTLDDSKDEIEHNFTLRYITLALNEVTRYGPETTATFTFDKKYFQIQFEPIDFCLNWGVEKTHSIERQIQSQLVGILLKRCSECSTLFSTHFMRHGLFLCQANPTKTSYRSTLVNPLPTTNAAELVGIIQNWVSTDPSLILDDRLVRVDSDCPTCIECLDADECVSRSDTGPVMGEMISQVLSVCAVRYLGQQICTI